MTPVIRDYYGKITDSTMQAYKTFKAIVTKFPTNSQFHIIRER